MTRHNRLALFAAACAVLATAAPLAAAQAQAPAARSAFDATTLDLAAEGVVKAAPDMATVTLGVTATAATASAASQAEAQKMAATLSALKARGIEARDIQTSGLSLNARYEFPQNQPRKLMGYEASNRVTIVVRDIARTGAVIDAAVAAGANGIDGVSFSLANPKPLQDEARRKAVAALTDKAQLYAGATGLRIQRLVNLTEGSEGPSQPMPMFKAVAARSMAMDSAPTPVEGGEVEVRVTVAATYELGR